jgi:hypothetical protein
LVTLPRMRSPDVAPRHAGVSDTRTVYALNLNAGLIRRAAGAM